MSILYKWDKKYWLLLSSLIFGGVLLNVLFWQISPSDLLEEDMYYIWLEGKRIANGENPYARVLAGNMRNNDDISTIKCK